MSLAKEDLQIAAALLLYPRAGWPMISEVLDMPESTVARRGKHLLDSGRISVTGNNDVLAAGSGFPVLLRIQTEQTLTGEVAARMAARSEVRTITIAAGSFQCNADIVVDSREHLSRLMITEFPKIPGIKNISTHVVLRRFTTAHAWDCGILSERQVDTLLNARPDSHSHDIDSGSDTQELTALDRRIIETMRDDGRISWRELAVQTSSQERTVQRRTLSLMSRGILRTRSFVKPSDLGLNVTSTLWLNVEPVHIEEVGRQLMKNKSVMLLVATTGHFNLCGEIATTNNRSLYDFTTRILGELPGIRQIDVAIEMTTLKRMSLLQPQNEGSTP